MEIFEIEDLEVAIGPSGSSDSVVGLPCGFVLGVIAAVIVLC